MKKKLFPLAKERNIRYPAQTITDYADDIVLLSNTPAQDRILLHGLERVAADIGFYVNAYKTEHMCFNQKAWTAIYRLSVIWKSNLTIK